MLHSCCDRNDKVKKRCLVAMFEELSSARAHNMRMKCDPRYKTKYLSTIWETNYEEHEENNLC